MSDTKFPEIITTDTCILISEWPTVAELVRKHSTTLKSGGYSKPDNPTPLNVLSQKQLKEVLAGPYGPFFRDKLRAYAILARLRMAHNIEEQDNLKDNRTTALDILSLPENALKNISKDTVKSLQSKLDELTTTQNQQIEGNLVQWQFSVIGTLRTANLNPSDAEVDEFSSPEPLSELMDRYTDLNIAPPKTNKILSFADYLKLKAYLMILSALSRQHQSNQPKDIEQYMKPLKKPLSEIQKNETALFKTQGEETLALIKARG